jgi:hypothetical protein
VMNDDAAHLLLPSDVREGGGVVPLSARHEREPRVASGEGTPQSASDPDRKQERSDRATQTQSVNGAGFAVR